ncbi:hypothetical protein GH733_019634 [Mirounga leonina]|nr:hypothetical protein GH733_019634 [Mirounga leonina]
MSVSVGQKVILTCTGNSYNVEACYVGWYQQISQGAPKAVMLINTRPLGIPASQLGTQEEGSSMVDSMEGVVGEGTSGKELWKPERNQVKGRKSASCTELAMCQCGPIPALDLILIYVVLQESPQSGPLSHQERRGHTHYAEQE